MTISVQIKLAKEKLLQPYALREIDLAMGALFCTPEGEWQQASSNGELHYARSYAGEYDVAVVKKDLASVLGKYGHAKIEVTKS